MLPGQQPLLAEGQRVAVRLNAAHPGAAALCLQQQ